MPGMNASGSSKEALERCDHNKRDKQQWACCIIVFLHKQAGWQTPKNQP